MQTEQTNNSAGVLRSYFIIVGLYTLSTSVIWGINTLFLLDAGLDIFGVFVANAVFTASMVLFEIPTGVVADTRGRRVSLLFSMAVLVVGTMGYVLAAEIGGGLLLFCLMSVILGLGYTFYSGALEAWLVDALDATNYKGRLDQVFARGSMVSAAAMLIGSVVGGVLGTVNLSIPFLVRSALLVAVFVVALFTMHDLGFAPRTTKMSELPAEMKKITKASITYGWQRQSVRLIMITAFIQGIFFMWAFYAAQPYLLDLLGQNLPWVTGVIAALSSLAMMAGNGLVEWATRYCARRTTLLLWATAIQSVAAIGMGLVDSFWLATPLFLVVMGTMGVWMPVKQAYIHQVIPSKQRATVISFESLVGSSGSVIGQIGLGRLSQAYSIAAGYVVGGLITVAVLPVVFRLRRLNEPADFITVSSAKTAKPAAMDKEVEEKTTKGE